MITTDCRFAFDQKLGYVTALPKLINEFVIKINVRIHETLEYSSSGSTTVDKKKKKEGEDQGKGEEEEEEKDDGSSDEEFDGLDAEMMGPVESGYQSYKQLMKPHKFQCIRDNGKKSDNPGYSTMWEYQQIENKCVHAMTE